MARFLLQNGSSVKERTKYGETPLILAVTTGNSEIVSLLVEVLAYFSTSSFPQISFPLDIDIFGISFLSKKYNPEFEEFGADLHARDHTESTALHCATMYGHESIVRYLLERGADVKAENNYGCTSFLLSVINNYMAIAQLLRRDYGATLTEKNNEAETALLCAANEVPAPLLH